MFSSQLLIYSIIVLGLYMLWTRRRFYQLMFKIPGPWGYPLLGIALEVRNKETFIKCFEKHEKKSPNHWFYSWQCFSPFLIIADPQIAQDLLTSPTCVNRTIVAEALSTVFGLGLFTLKEPVWSRHRKLLNPAFNNKVLMSFFPIFNEESEKILSTIDDYCGCSGINAFEILKGFTFTLTTRTMMDRDLTIETTKNDQHLAVTYEYLASYAMDIILSPWLRFNFIRKLLRSHPEKNGSKRQIDEFVKKRITTKKALQTKTQPLNEKNNFINLALKLMDKGEFSYQNVEDHAHVIVIAGFETTNHSIACILTTLAMFPEYQEKLFEEIITLYPERGNFDVNLAEIQQMVYMDMVINETMRVMAPVPVLFRELSDDLELSNGITLPKGLQVGVDIFNMQRRTDIWGPNAHIFNPDNFLPANLENKHPYGFIPFAKGLRNCIGWRYSLLSIKIVLAKLIRNYQFTTDFKFENLEFVQDISLKFKVVPQIQICRRDI